MEAPPPYRKKSNTGLIVGIVIGAVVLCCIGPIALFGGLGIWGWGKIKPMLECGATFQVARDAVRQYADDHHGKMPDGQTWMDDVRPYYVKVLNASQSPFKPMPAQGIWGCDDGNGGRTGMALNSDVAGSNMSDVKNDVAVLFEIRHATANATQKYEQASFTDSPLMFGDHRGWFLVYIDGAPGIYDKTGRFTEVNTATGKGR